MYCTYLKYIYDLSKNRVFLFISIIPVTGPNNDLNLPYDVWQRYHILKVGKERTNSHQLIEITDLNLSGLEIT